MKRQGWLSLLGFATVATLATTAAACGGSSNPPSSSNPTDSSERITGNERLGWNQAAADANELATFRYAAYVDNNRVELADVSCGSSGASFSCNSRMPAMSPGAHTLELVTFVLSGGAVIESGRSSPIRVTLAAVTAGADPRSAAQSRREVITSDGVRLRVDVVTEQLDAPTALAFAQDGRMFVAERDGRVRILPGNAIAAATDLPEPALVLTDVLTMSQSEGGLMGLALDPEFEQTRLLYALYTTADGNGAPRFRLSRFREVGGRLGERVVLLDSVPASPDRPAASIGIGPDRRLYAAFDDAGDPVRAQPLASYSGKVLRLNPDGTTPEDQPAASPVYSSAYQSPRGLDWHPVTGALWVADAIQGDVEELRVIEAGAVRSTRTATRARILLPARTGAASLAFYRGELLPTFRGDLLIAADEGRHLLRLRFDRRESTRLVSSERLLQDFAQNEGVHVVSVGPDGAVYLCTDRAVLRLGPM